MQQKIDKIRVAESQLRVAIRLFFEDGDDVAVHTLARAAHEILDQLCAHKGLERGVVQEGLKNYIKPEHHKTVIDAVNKAKNFFKHADKDPSEILTWDPSASEYFIWDATALHRRLTGGIGRDEIPTFSLWFRIQHPELWVGSAPIEEFLPRSTTKDELKALSKRDFFQISMEAWRRI